VLFVSPLFILTLIVLPTYYQDRLGTNIGKVEKRRRFYLAAGASVGTYYGSSHSPGWYV
jgi:hypothetical protein